MSEKLDLDGLTFFKYCCDKAYATKTDLATAGKVKTVNDAEPDTDGNINIDVNDPDIPVSDVEGLFDGDTDTDTTVIPLENIADFIVDSGTRTNDDGSIQWFRQWNSGWLEQGGLCIGDFTENEYWCIKTVNYMRPFKDMTYNFYISGHHNQDPLSHGVDDVVDPDDDEKLIINTTSVMISMSREVGQANWYACGQGAAVPNKTLLGEGKIVRKVIYVNDQYLLTNGQFGEVPHAYLEWLVEYEVAEIEGENSVYFTTKDYIPKTTDYTECIKITLDNNYSGTAVFQFKGLMSSPAVINAIIRSYDENNNFITYNSIGIKAVKSNLDSLKVRIPKNGYAIISFSSNDSGNLAKPAISYVAVNSLINEVEL